MQPWFACRDILDFYDNDGILVALLFNVHGIHLRSCLDGQLT